VEHIFQLGSRPSALGGRAAKRLVTGLLVMNEFQLAVNDEAAKLIKRFEIYARDLADEQVRRRRRTTAPGPPLRLMRPEYWTLAPGFNPYLVRARQEQIGHSIQRAVRLRTYRPHNAVGYEIDKSGGSVRKVAVFQVADNAVSRRVFISLLEKNRAKLSARSYAYRDDITAHDAIQYIRTEFESRDRLFIAEYDFSAFFDTIDHEHIWRTIRDQHFLLTSAEEKVIASFLEAPTIPMSDYKERGGPMRDRGVPQGTSISLFLANLAAWPLDRILENLGVGFVRYADDTLIWSTDYVRICAAADALFEQSRAMGSAVNAHKSKGIRLMSKPGIVVELPGTTAIEFLGYKLGLGMAEMRDTAVARVKHRLLELLYFNLLYEPERGTQQPDRVGSQIDRDYVVFIWQARRFLYGDLSEVELRRFQGDDVPLRRFKGLMAYYPLIDDTPTLRELDAWLATTTWLTMRKRARLLSAANFRPLPAPHGLSRNELIRYRRKSRSTGGVLDLRIPSFRRMAGVMRRAARQHGPNQAGRKTEYAY
jgi:hypothetical protein